MTAVNCDYCKWSVGARCARHDKPFNGSESCADQRANGNECGPDGDLFEPMTDTNTSGAEVDVLKSLKRFANVESPLYIAVAALIEREAALITERAALAAEVKALRGALEHIQGLHSHDKSVFELAAHCYDAKTISTAALDRASAATGGSNG